MCIRHPEGVFGKYKNAVKWNDTIFPIKYHMYTVTDTRIDCQKDLGYKIEGLSGWWTHDLFQEVKYADNYDFISSSKEIVKNKAKLEFTSIVIKYCLDHNINVSNIEVSVDEGITEFLCLYAYNGSILLTSFGKNITKIQGWFKLPDEYITDRLNEYLNDFTDMVYAISNQTNKK